MSPFFRRQPQPSASGRCRGLVAKSPTLTAAPDFFRNSKRKGHSQIKMKSKVHKLVNINYFDLSPELPIGLTICGNLY